MTPKFIKDIEILSPDKYGGNNVLNKENEILKIEILSLEDWIGPSTLEGINVLFTFLFPPQRKEEKYDSRCTCVGT